jgi:subtilisin family serine protease
VCLPLGGLRQSVAEKTVYARMAELGVTVVCAAGNDTTDQPTYPAGYPDCIGVAALGADNRLAPFSNFGDWVTTAAPAVDIPLAVGRAEYRNWSGTSFAAAMVAGTVALIRQANQSLTVDKIKQSVASAGGAVLHAGDGLQPADFRMLDACAAVRAAVEHKQPRRKSAKPVEAE